MTLDQRHTLIQLFANVSNIGKEISGCSKLSFDSSTDTMKRSLMKLQINATHLISTLTEIATIGSQIEHDDAENPALSNTVFNHEIVRICRDNYSMILHMPAPLPRHTDGKSAALRYPYRSELQRSLIRHRPALGFFPKENHLVFLFAKGSNEQGPLDHDNYYVKPIIDTITNALGISDTGLKLALTYYSTNAGTLESGLYVLLFPGQDNPISKSEAISRCAAAEWLNQ